MNTEDSPGREVERARKGDRAAFAATFRRFARMVHGIGLARLSVSEADDLVQDVFIAAFEQIHTLAEKDAIGGWLAQIARNRALDLLRKQRRHDHVPIDAAGQEHLATNDPEHHAEANRVLHKILALPEAYRETLILRLVEGMSGPEIATQVGMTPDSVRVNLHRGMKLLKEAI
jgi:RNA polymerase sigma-70 factor, ECF subfamily